MIKQQQLVAAKIGEAESLSRANIALANEDNLTKLANRRSFLSNLNDHVHNVSLGQAMVWQSVFLPLMASSKSTMSMGIQPATEC